jgi:hypothetical protein
LVSGDEIKRTLEQNELERINANKTPTKSDVALIPNA